MKPLLLTAGIMAAAACVLSLLYAALNFHGYNHVVDGSANLYRRLRQRAVIFFACGIFLAVTAAVCFIFSSKI